METCTLCKGQDAIYEIKQNGEWVPACFDCAKGYDPQNEQETQSE